MVKADFSKAKWIWTKDNLTVDQKIVARKKFEVGEVPVSAKAYIASDTKFWLWVNGEPVVYEGGVFRESLPGSGYAEEVELAPYLKRGENLIAALVWFFGNGGRNNVNSGEAGFIFSCDILGVYSDTGFRVLNHPAYVKTGTPHPAYLYGGDNVGFDARLDFGNFTAAAFDDSSFEQATIYENKVWGGQLCVTAASFVDSR